MATARSGVHACLCQGFLLIRRLAIIHFSTAVNPKGKDVLSHGSRPLWIAENAVYTLQGLEFGTGLLHML